MNIFKWLNRRDGEVSDEMPKGNLAHKSCHRCEFWGKIEKYDRVHAEYDHRGIPFRGGINKEGPIAKCHEKYSKGCYYSFLTGYCDDWSEHPKFKDNEGEVE